MKREADSNHSKSTQWMLKMLICALLLYPTGSRASEYQKLSIYLICITRAFLGKNKISSLLLKNLKLTCQMHAKAAMQCIHYSKSSLSAQ